MKFTSTLLAALGISSTASAAAVAPIGSNDATKARLTARLDELRGRGAQKQSTPPTFLASSSAKGFKAASAGTTAGVDTLNWSGGVVEGTGLNYVRGSWVVPTPKEAPGVDPTDQSAAIWVGIDGAYCNGGLIQAGTIFDVRDGVVSHYAWYEWFPDYAVIPIDTSVLPVEAGDLIRTSINAFTPTSGQIQVENLTKYKSFQYQFSGMTDNPLCMHAAEWIVEDLSVGGGLAPFADYTNVTFTDTYTNQGDSSQAILFTMNQNNDDFSTCQHNGASSIKCNWLTSV